MPDLLAIDETERALISDPSANFPQAPGMDPIPRFVGDQELLTAPGQPARLNTKKEGDFLSRFQAGLLRPDQRADFWRSKGFRLERLPNGNVYIFDPETNQYYEVDKKTKAWLGFAGNPFKDIADASGTVPSIVAGLASAPTMGGQAAGSVVGEGVRQGIAEVVYPEGDNFSPTGLATEGALGGAAQGVINGAVSAGRWSLARATGSTKFLDPALDPTVKQWQADLAGEYGQKVAGVVDEIGLIVPPGVYGNRPVGSFELFARRHPQAREFFRSNADQNGAIYLEWFQKTLDEYGGRITDDEAGRKVHDAYMRTIEAADETRRANAKIGFGRVAQLTGNAPILQDLPHFKEALEEVLEDNRVLAEANAAPHAKRFFNLAEAHLRQLEKIGPVDALELQKFLSTYGKMSAGKSLMFADAPAMISEERRHGAKLVQSLLQDLDEIAPGTSPAHDALRVARDRFRSDSEAIRVIQETELGRLFQTSGEKVTPQQIVAKLHKMSPQNTRHAANVLREQAPDALRQFQQVELGRVFQVGFPVSPHAHVGDTTINPAALKEALQESKVWETLGPAQRPQMVAAVDGLDVLLRLQTFNRNLGPGTELPTNTVIRSLGFMNPKVVAGRTAMAIGGGQVAEAAAKLFTTDEGLRHLTNLRRAKYDKLTDAQAASVQQSLNWVTKTIEYGRRSTVRGQEDLHDLGLNELQNVPMTSDLMLMDQLHQMRAGNTEQSTAPPQK